MIKIYKRSTTSFVSKDCLTYGTDNNTTVRGLEERHGVSWYGGEVGKGEKEDGPHQSRVS